MTTRTGRANEKPDGLRILPLGGLGEIGMNCMVLEYEDEIIVIDCGIHFSDLDHFGVEFVIPDFAYLMERKEKVKAFIMTHGHEDHIGALPFIFKSGVRAPIYASAFSSLLINHRMKEYGYDTEMDLRTFRMGDEIKLKHFKIKTVSVNHSIVDAAALLIDTPLGKVIHTGDFKIDPMPFYGEMLDDRVFKKAGDEGVLLLMSDSTNVERCTHSTSEQHVYERFEQILAASQGLTIISTFASNIGRMGQVFEIARRMGKRIALSGRTMENNVLLAQQAGYLKNASEVLISLADIDSFDRKNVLVLSTGSQGEYRSALARVSQGEHGQIKLQQGDLVVLSSKFIPGNEKAIGRMINNLFMQGAEVLYEAVSDIHASGHATRPELKSMVEWTKPRFFMPIHGEYRHLVHHAKVAEEGGVKKGNVVIAVNGDVMELAPESFEIVDHIDEPRVLVEGREGNDVSRLVLKDRRQMGEKGMVFSLLVRNAESLKIISGPEIIARGLAHENVEGWLIEEAKNIVRKVVSDYERGLFKGPAIDLQETIRIELRRFFNNNIGKKPVVLPIVLDL